MQVVHSDLKSLNILLTRGWELAKIGDVGVARFMHAKEVRSLSLSQCLPHLILGVSPSPVAAVAHL